MANRKEKVKRQYNFRLPDDISSIIDKLAEKYDMNKTNIVELAIYELENIFKQEENQNNQNNQNQ